MAECVLMKSGGGADLDVVTATAADIVAPKVIVGQDGEPVTGTMVDRGNWNASDLAAGATVTIPAGKHGGGGKVTARSLAAQTGGATATDQYVKSGMTYWKDGVKRTGTMAVSSVVSFSVAAYSTSQALCTWKNPAKGPYGGVLICAKAGGYPNNAWDGITYQGVGSNSALNGTSTVLIGGLSAGVTYYFRIWVYCICSAETLYSGYLQAACTVTNHGRAAFTSSGVWTVPAGVRSINVHCTGGGGGGGRGCLNGEQGGGGGGGGGYTAYQNGISVQPGTQYTITVGSGGTGDKEMDYGVIDGMPGSASSFGNIISAAGGKSGSLLIPWADTNGLSNGGSGGGRGAGEENKKYCYFCGNGGSDGGNGYFSTAVAGSVISDNMQQFKGQGSTTREFGQAGGTLYSGGGGGGTGYFGYADKYRSPGGAGGGGNGTSQNTAAGNGAFGTGGGGGGGGREVPPMSYCGGRGGSGNVIITW